MKTILRLSLVALAFTSITAHAQNRGRGGGGGMPAEFQELIHELFANPEKIRRLVDLTADGYLAETTTTDPKLVAVLQEHVEQMSGRLAGGRPVRRWDPAFGEFFTHYDDMDHKFTKLDNGIRAEVTGKTPAAIAAAQNHARIIFDFSSKGDAEMHQPHRTVLDDDGGEGDRFHGGPPDAREAKLAKPFAEQAHEAADALIKALGGQLKAAMKEGGPEAALPVCNTVAGPMTERLSDSHEGLSIKRVTDKPRNAANGLDKLDRAVLERFRAAPEDARPLAHLATERDGRGVRYYRPLVVGAVCLNCHGDKAAMSAELKTAIGKLYPEDKAYGYSLGDIRGLIRIDRVDAE